MRYGSKYYIGWADHFSDAWKVFVQERNRPNGITGFTNSAGGVGSYDTFTISGTTISSAIVADNAGRADSDESFVVAEGDIIEIVFDLTLNSGEAPYFDLDGVSCAVVQSADGSNIIRLVALEAGTATIKMYNLANTNFSTDEIFAYHVEAVKAAANPLTPTWDTPSDDPHEPINGSFSTMRLVCESNGQFKELFTNDRTKYRVLEQINAADYMQWFVLPDQYQEPYKGPPYAIEVVASDGLGHLRNLIWEETGVKSIQWILQKVLWETGLELDLQEGLNIYEDAHDKASSDSPIDQTWIDAEIYTDFSYYEVLQAVLRRFTAIIKQKGAEWHILRPDEMRSPFYLRKWAVHPTLPSWTYSSVQLFDPIVATTRSDGSPLVRVAGPGTMFINPGWKKFKIITNYGNALDTFVDNPHFENWASGVPTGWTAAGTPTYYQNGSRVQFNGVAVFDSASYLYQEWTLYKSTDQKILLNFKYHITTQVTGNLTIYFAIIITNSGTDYYWNFSTGAWDSAAARYYSKTYLANETVLHDELSAAISSGAAASGILKVRFYEPVRAGGSGGFFLLDEAEMKLVDYDPVGGGYTDFETEEETAVTVRDNNLKDAGDITLYTADGGDYDNAHLIFLGALFTAADQSTAAGNWRTNRDGGSLNEILEEVMKRQHFYHAQTLQVTLYAPYDSFSVVNILKEINNEHRLFMPKRVDYDSKYGRWQLEAIELPNDMIRTVVKTIGHPGETGTDYAFTSAANSNAQNLEIEDIVPANARVIDAILITTEAWDDGIDMAAGNASAGTQYFTAVAMETLANIGQPSTGGCFEVDISGSITSVWIQGDPDNNWEDITTGETSLIVTYIDNDPVK